MELTQVYTPAFEYYFNSNEIVTKKNRCLTQVSTHAIVNCYKIVV